MFHKIKKSHEGSNGATSAMETIFLLIAGIVLYFFGGTVYHGASTIGQVMWLIIYLALLVGIAPLPMPVFRSKYTQTMCNGLMSGLLDSFIILLQCRRLRTVEAGQDRNEIMHQKHNQPTVGIRAAFLSLQTLAALIGGLVIWFGEVYAAGNFLLDGRTGPLSAMFILPPVLVFLSILGIHASTLPIETVQNHSIRTSVRDFIEFGCGVGFLLFLPHSLGGHNPMMLLGVLVVYAILTGQAGHLLDTFKHHTEVSVMLVLIIAFFGGDWLVANVIKPAGLDAGTLFGFIPAPVVPSIIQSVLWGGLYTDPTVHFWERIAILSTGAMVLPVSSLVGVMLFPLKQWWLYMKYSIPYAILWYIIVRVWIWIALDSPVGAFLEQWAHNGGTH